jgi:hypothetical protein
MINSILLIELGSTCCAHISWILHSSPQKPDSCSPAAQWATRKRIVGRAPVVGLKVKTHLDDEGMFIPEISEIGKETAVWEAYAEDLRR